MAFVGYPGNWKLQRTDGVVSIGSYEYYGFVQTVEHDQFSVRVDHTDDIFVRNDRDPDGDSQTQLSADLGGLSGAPIFQAADRPKLVGIISEGGAWSMNAQKIFAVHIDVLDKKGKRTAQQMA